MSTGEEEKDRMLLEHFATQFLQLKYSAAQRSASTFASHTSVAEAEVEGGDALSVRAVTVVAHGLQNL